MKENFKNRLCKIMNITGSNFDEIYSKKAFRGIRINTLKTNFNIVQKSFDFHLEPTPFFKDEYYIPSNFEKIGNTPLHHAGGFYVQEPSATSVLSVLDVKAGDKILDLCAAPGGKSTGIAALLNNQGLLWSNEYIRNRASILLSNIERMGVSNCVVSSFDSKYLAEKLEGFFDTVLIDAPCSGEGMWRHNPLVENEWSESSVLECAQRQKEILANGAKTLKSGGVLVYSTCTFSVEENEENVKWFLENFNDFSLEKIDLPFGQGGVFGDNNIDNKVKRIFPTQGGEGHFIAKFKKNKSFEKYDYNYITQDISKENSKIVNAFLSDNFAKIPDGVLIEKNGLVYLVPHNTPKILGDILRYGLFIGEIRKTRLEPSHALFACPSAVPKRILDLSLFDERVELFLKGNEIKINSDQNGYVGIMVEGCPLGFGKYSNGRVTNKYPKGLRLL